LTIAIHGIGVVGGFGAGIGELEEALAAKRTVFSNAPLPGHEKKICLAQTDQLEEFVPKKALRRIDHFSQMAILAAFLAVKNAKTSLPKGQELGIILASGYGATRTTFAFLDSVINNGDRCASPTHFSNSVHNSAAAHISILMEASGPNLTVSRLDMSFPAALLIACQWITEERVESVLIGGVDEYCPVLGFCWDRFFGQSGRFPKTIQPNLPVRRTQTGLQSPVIGEGSVFFLLSGNKKGDLPHYGSIDSVRTGNLNRENIPFSENAVLIIGDDGHQACHRHYRTSIPRCQEVVSYAPIYGSLPIGIGFDLAIAALSLKRGSLFPMPSHPMDRASFNVLKTAKPTAGKTICCLKISSGKEFGMVTVAGSHAAENRHEL
jgi:3-oxoacyl-[acyl-carrier-protein] synthase II